MADSVDYMVPEDWLTSSICPDCSKLGIPIKATKYHRCVCGSIWQQKPYKLVIIPQSKPQILRKLDNVTDRKCKACQSNLIRLDWNSTHELFACDNFDCHMSRQPQGCRHKLSGKITEPDKIAVARDDSYIVCDNVRVPANWNHTQLAYALDRRRTPFANEQQILANFIEAKRKRV